MSSNGWNTWKIGDIGRIVTGKTPPTQNPNNFGDKYPFITPRDMQGQKRIYQTERYLSEDGRNAVKNCLLPANSVCVSCIGSDMGKVVMTTKDSVTNQQLNSVICKASFEPNFVYYALVNISDELRNVGHHSTAVPILNKTDFSNFEIIAPSLPTQRRIADILSALDDKIELNCQANATLEAIAQAIFKEWFVDFNFLGATGGAGLEPARTWGADSVGAGIRVGAGLEPAPTTGMIPHGWRVGKLGDIVELNPRLPLKKGTAAKYVEMKDLSSNSATIKGFIEREFSSGSKFGVGDTLLARITPCLENGKTGIVDFLENDEIGWGSTEFIVMRGKKFISPFFVYCLARQQVFREFAIQSMIGSSGRQRVVETILADFSLVIPNEIILQHYHKIAEPLFKQITENADQSATLAAIRDALLPKLMNGEIDV